MRTCKFIVPLVVLFSLANFADLASSDRVAIKTFLREKLELANRNKEVQLLMNEKDVDIIANTIADANSRNEPFYTESVKCSLLSSDQSVIGYITMSMGAGIHLILESQNDRPEGYNPKESDIFATLEQITIFDNYQGFGYSSKALDIFDEFLDDIGVNYIFLSVSSGKPYTANIYYKKNYRFTTKTMDAIQKTIGSLSAFLKDSTQQLLHNGKPQIPYMVRTNEKTP